MSLAVTGIVVGVGGAVAAGAMSQQASKKAASQMRNGVQTFDPIEPQDPYLLDWRRSALDAYNFNNNQQGVMQNISGQVNRFNRGQALQNYRRFQPYFEPLQRQIGENALSFSRGQLPDDVVASIGRAAAQRGIQSGFGQGLAGAGAGTPISNLNLRNLGLTSLQLSQYGTNLAMNANQQAKNLSPALFDPSSLMVGPNQAIQYEQNQINTQNDAMRYWNQLQNQAQLGNVSAQNTANMNATNTELAGRLAMAKQVAAAGSAAAGGIGQIGMGGGGYIPQGQGGYVPAYPGTAQSYFV